MSDLTRAEQARSNGAKSRGPVTPEGKARSARNATKHGLHVVEPPFLAAHTAVLNNEDGSLFVDLLRRRTLDLRPTNSTELDLVRELCSIEWRLDRIQALEIHTINLQSHTEAEALRRARGDLRGITPLDITAHTFAALMQQPRALSFYGREFTRLQRCRRETLHALLVLRKQPKLAEQSEEPEEFQQLDELLSAGTNPRLVPPVDLNPSERAATVRERTTPEESASDNEPSIRTATETERGNPEHPTSLDNAIANPPEPENAPKPSDQPAPSEQPATSERAATVRERTTPKESAPYNETPIRTATEKERGNPQQSTSPNSAVAKQPEPAIAPAPSEEAATPKAPRSAA